MPAASCSFSYSAAAVITNEEGVEGVPYLDKFTVGIKSQVCENLVNILSQYDLGKMMLDLRINCMAIMVS